MVIPRREPRSSHICSVDGNLERLCCCDISNGVFAVAGVRLQMLRAATPSQALGTCCSLFGVCDVVF